MGQFGSKRLISLGMIIIALLAIPVLLYSTRQPVNDQVKAASFADADVDHNGLVNLSDASFISVVITNKQYLPAADLNHDKVVDEKDLKLFYKLLSQ